jgi:tetratricopeptide (TPR) repeat protein
MTAAVQPLRPVSLPSAAPASRQEDEFLTAADLVPVKQEAARRTGIRILAEIEELFKKNGWEDVLALFHPVEEKVPETANGGIGVAVRAKIAFALGQLHRFDAAITELQRCLEAEPENFYHHSSLAYTAYNSLYAAKNHETVLSGKLRAERLALAHRHFEMAQILRPDGVTNFYRQAMLLKQLEGKPAQALPKFAQAVAHWENLDAGQQQQRHQERKNYVKSLYQLASCLLNTGKAPKALDAMKKCLAEDEHSQHIERHFKYFALGKIHFHLNRFAEARDALLFALQCGAEPADYICELLARTYLAMDNPPKAREVIGRVPEKRRRPYYRWTEADVLCALADYARARQVLEECAARDGRSRHKALVRLAKIAYHLADYRQTIEKAAAASRFFEEKWGGALDHGLFWEALGRLRLGQVDKARDLALKLKDFNDRYPKLDKLLAAVQGEGQMAEGQGLRAKD